MPERDVPQQWLHGFLDLCLLNLLAERRDYGLGLSQRLAEAGLGAVPGGTLYPALVRLESQGHVVASWEPSSSGPRRKYFHLTAEGAATARALAARWEAFRDGIDGAVARGAVTHDAAPREERGVDHGR